MADVVVVVGTRRGHEGVSAAEIRQMVGRAGRRHGGATCEAYVILDDEDLDDIRDGMNDPAGYEVKSSLESCDNLVFHLLAEVCGGSVSDEQEAESWYSRSFGAFQGLKPNFKRAMAKLMEYGAVEENPLGYMPTKMGTIASELYFHPADVKAWKDNFDEVFNMGLEREDSAIAWALGSVPVMAAPGDFGKHRFVLSLCKEAIPAGLEVKPGMLTKITLWWSALGGPSVGRMRNQMLGLRDDFGRIYRALLRMDKEVAMWGKEVFFKELESRVRKGIPVHLKELCKLPGITKGRADYLYELGVRDRNGIRDIIDSIDGEVDEPFLNDLRGIANGVF